MFEVAVKTEFSAAHKLVGHKGPCAEIHGHNWVVEATFASKKLDNIGMVIDFADVNAELEEAKLMLDHKLINDVEPFTKLNPTAEHLAKWFFEKLKKSLPVSPTRVTVYETSSSSASYIE